MEKKKNIIIISNESWGEIWYSKHHYAHELSKTNNVFFINPTSSWKLKNLFQSKVQSHLIHESLTVLNYYNFLPHFFFKFNNSIVSKRIFKFFNKQKIEVDIFWTFDPYRLFNPRLLKSKKSIFHVVDKYLFIHKAEIPLHKNVDGFVVVAEDFREQYEQYKKPIIFIPHGISLDKLSLNNPIDSTTYQNYILYVGQIDSRLDYELIVKLAIEFPNETFLFVGGLKEVNNENYNQLFIQKKFKNIIHIPPVHALLLSEFIKRAKVCIAPMWDGWAGNMISHHKVLQYLAYGKPVFSPVFSAYKSFSELLYMETSHDNFIDKMKKFISIGESNHLIDERIKLALENSYNKHVESILNFIQDLDER